MRSPAGGGSSSARREVGDGAVGRALLHRLARRVAQRSKRPLVAARRHREQVRGDPLGGRAGVGEQRRAARRVGELALAGRRRPGRRPPGSAGGRSRAAGRAQDLGLAELAGRARRDGRARRSASAARVGTSKPSPRTPTARATAPASGDSRESRSSTARETARGPSSSTTPALAAVGAVPSSRIAFISSCRSSGLPPVAAWQASAKAGVGACAEPLLDHAAARASALSAPGRSELASGSRAISASSAASAPGSVRPGRRDQPIGTPSSRRAR